MSIDQKCHHERQRQNEELAQIEGVQGIIKVNAMRDAGLDVKTGYNIFFWISNKAIHSVLPEKNLSIELSSSRDYIWFTSVSIACVPQSSSHSLLNEWWEKEISRTRDWKREGYWIRPDERRGGLNMNLDKSHEVAGIAISWEMLWR